MAFFNAFIDHLSSEYDEYKADFNIFIKLARFPEVKQTCTSESVMEWNMSLAATIRSSRRAKKMTQAQLAEELGVSVQAVSQWENNHTTPGPRNVLVLSKLLDFSLQGPLGDYLNLEQPFHAVGIVAPTLEWEDVDYWLRLDGDDLTAAFFQDKPKPQQKVQWKPEGKVFTLLNNDLSMLPTFGSGDKLIFDSGGKPHPGDFVLAKVATEAHPVFRKFRIRPPEDDAATSVIELVPLNDDFPLHRIRSKADGLVIARLRELRREF